MCIVVFFLRIFYPVIIIFVSLTAARYQSYFIGWFDIFALMQEMLS